MSLLDNLLLWAELIAILIPLLITIVFKPRGREARPLVFYSVIAFLPNLFIVLISEENIFRQYLPKSNHIFYNIHSIIKVIFWGWYLSNFKELKSSGLIKISIGLYLLFAIINYTFFENCYKISNRMANIENVLLLLFCIAFFLATIIDDSDIIWMNKPVFAGATFINLYAAINFFIFLFFNYFNVKDVSKKEFGGHLMNIFILTYVVLCSIFAWIIIKDRNSTATVKK